MTVKVGIKRGFTALTAQQMIMEFTTFDKNLDELALDKMSLDKLGINLGEDYVSLTSTK